MMAARTCNRLNIKCRGAAGSCNNSISTKTQTELRLAASIKGNKKGLWGSVEAKRKSKIGRGPLLKVNMMMIMDSGEKIKWFHFCFVSLFSVKENTLQIRKD